jgi:DNA (cytosine-5)-methyltransferase 1
MSGRPKLLDLFCCAGGAAKGYHDAGWDVFGVDIRLSPRYPFAAHRGDALGVLAALLRGEKVAFVHRDGRVEHLGLADFDAIHASPPCQGYTAMRHAPGAKGAPRLIAAVRDELAATGLPWVIENVEEARSEMRSPVMLCGTSFGLGAHGCELRRHRLFESNVSLVAPACEHGDGPVVGVYGGHARIRSARHGGRGTRDAWPNGHKPVAAEAMQMPWATLAEMSEAIPPAYTRHIGAQLLAHVASERTAA